MSEDKVKATPEVKVAEKKRKERIPLGRLRTKLSVPQREGFVRRWVNDTPGRLHDFERAGYTFVTDSELIVGEGNDVAQRPGIGSVVSRTVGVKEGGQPLQAFLMEQVVEDYEEDQQEKMRELDEREAAIRRGQDERGRPGDGTRYVPAATPIKIDHGSAR